MLLKKISIFFIGLAISCIGALPFGNINLVALRLSVTYSISTAILFSLGALLVEMIYVRISLLGLSWLLRKKKLLKQLDWFSIAIFIVLSIASFWQMIHHQKREDINTTILFLPISPFFWGMFLSLINPLQFPFWIGWSTILITKNILIPRESFYWIYIIGIGMGSFLGLLLFILGGQYLFHHFSFSDYIFNLILGILFLITALLLLLKTLFFKHWTDK